MKPVLLLIPGMLNDARIWAWVTPHLQNDADIRIADVLSQGSIAEMARDAWAQVADVPPDTPLVVCGFSMGGYVAIEMMANNVRSIRAVWLLDTSARPESKEGGMVREKTIAAIERNFPKVVEGILQFGTHADSHADAALMDRMRQMMLSVGPEVAVRQNRAIASRGDRRERLATLDIPTIVLCGRDDKITPSALSEELAALIPGARLEWIDQAGHMTPLEQPERVAALLKAFL
ncbi:MAG: alpha/beta fold hydrolase [Burkholderiaceae bacterium]|nr:alpha/beta fold hydrolase [Burkholderiaceae bacterium]